MSTTKTYSLYLAKSTVKSLDDLLTDNARDLIQNGRAHRVLSPEFADSSALYTFPGLEVTPKWAKQLAPIFAIKGRLVSQSSCAILAFEKDKKIFAVTFSYGHVYLDDSRTEADFGLKVAINAVSDNKLRSVERSNIGAAIRDFAQAAGQRDLKSFGFDEALDLIRKVSGYATDDDFADLVTGSRALRFTKKMEITEIPDAALEAVKFFGLGTYKKTAFKIIDFLSPILDTVMQESLDADLVKAIRAGSDEIEIAIPEILPDSVGTFRFEHVKSSMFHPDLSLELYRDALGADLNKITIDDIKRHKIAAYADDGELKVEHWSVKDLRSWIIGSRH